MINGGRLHTPPRPWSRCGRLALVALPIALAACAGGDVGPQSEDPAQRGATREPAPPSPFVTDSLSTTPPVTSLDSLRDEIRALRAELGAIVRDDAPQPQVPEAEALAQGAGRVGLRLLWAVLVLAMSWTAIEASVWMLDRLGERAATRRLLIKKAIPLVRLGVWVIAAYVIVAHVFAIQSTQLIAATAALGVVIGLAAQDILKNLFGGLIIVFDQPFQVGDKISVDGTYGEVVSIGLRATRLVTPDDSLVSVPNMKVVESKVANANAGALDCQVVVDLWLPGWVDVTAAKAIAHEAAVLSPYVYLKKPVVVNAVDEFRETFLTHLKVKAYVIDTRYEFRLASDITERAKAEFLRRDMLPPILPFAEKSMAMVHRSSGSTA